MKTTFNTENTQTSFTDLVTHEHSRIRKAGKTLKFIIPGP